MLGCASERAVVILADSYAKALSTQRRQRFTQAIDGQTIIAL